MVLCFEECVILRVITSVSFSGALRRQKKQVRLVPELRGCFGAAEEHLLNPLSNEQLTHNRTCLRLRGTSIKLCDIALVLLSDPVMATLYLPLLQTSGKITKRSCVILSCPGAH